MALKKIQRGEKQEDSEESSGSIEKPLVLYVEDDDTNWDLAQVALSSKYQVVRAKNAREAFRFLSEQDFTLILMDIELSGSNLNGIEITQVLKKIPSAPQTVFSRGIELDGTPIIFVTAYTARYRKEELLDAGGDDLVTKPVDFTRLSLAMSRMMVRQAYAPSQTHQPPQQPERPPDISERRHYVRKSKAMPCELLLGDMRYVGQSIDISPGGVKVIVDLWDAPDRFTVGTEFLLSLEPIWGDMKIPSQVARVCGDEPYTVGVAFMGIKAEQRKALEDWLYS